MMCNLETRPASDNLAQSLIILNFFCSPCLSNWSLATTKDSFTTLYLSFLKFNSFHLFTHNNNSPLRILIYSFMLNAFALEFFTSFSNPDTLSLRTCLRFGLIFFPFRSGGESQVNDGFGQIYTGEQFLQLSTGK